MTLLNHRALDLRLLLKSWYGDDILNSIDNTQILFNIENFRFINEFTNIYFAWKMVEISVGPTEDRNTATLVRENNQLVLLPQLMMLVCFIIKFLVALNH